MMRPMIRRTVRPAAVVFLLLALTGCVTEVADTPSAATAAQQTLDRMLTQVAIQSQDSPTPRPSFTSTASPTPKPTDTGAETEIPTVQFITSTPNRARPTFAGPSPTTDPISLLTRTITAKCNAAFFVGDVPPIRDGSDVRAGEQFTKVWDVRNIGTCSWDRSYHLIFQYGQHMSGPDYISFAQVVAPNGHIYLAVTLIAPATGGLKEGQWFLQDPDGIRFGVGTEGDKPLLVRINVVP
jgi:hypothetical protein